MHIKVRVLFFRAPASCVVKIVCRTFSVLVTLALTLKCARLGPSHTPPLIIAALMHGNESANYFASLSCSKRLFLYFLESHRVISC